MYSQLQPLFVAALAFAVAWLVASYRGSYREAALAEIDALRFGTFVGLVRRAMAAEGFETGCNLGANAQAAYEFDARRDGSRYLVSCKLGASTRVTARSLLALDQDALAVAADGAYVVTTGTVEAGARALARDLRIQLLDGADFWRTVRGALSEEQQRAIKRRLRTRFVSHARRGLIVGMLLGAAGASAMAFAQ